MPTPEFVVDLRRKIGHDPLWLPGVGGVVLDGDGRVLLGQRADSGRWAIITGMVDPGEQPAVALRREVEEETGVVVEVEYLLATGVDGPITFPNGDVCTFLTLDFRCRWVSGTARVNDDESLDVRWFPLDALPDLRPRHLALVRQAVGFDGVTRFAC
ncbi:NUDIX domain-containing protein [Arthrobacter sp. B0490]|uniref:NUDIX hydrolase n=1 Tax=Arthrobacter sp. B0490 TaxID=2058891 RepID=UPI000CE32E5D|nr:NUDIX domain-containing protein [Arthrobacter sp. B0490]